MRTERSDIDGADERTGKRANVDSVGVDTPTAELVETGTAGGDLLACDQTNRVGRRRVLRAMGGTGVAGVAGCLGGDRGGDATDDETDTDETDAGDNADDAIDDEGSGEAPKADDSDTESNGDGEDAQEIRPSDIDLAPEDGWADAHWDIEIPDEPGRAVLVYDGERFEMEGDCSGGPNDGVFETVSENDEFSGDGAYFLADGRFRLPEDEDGPSINFLRRMGGWSGNEFRYVNFDQFDLFPGEGVAAQYAYHESADGSVRDEERPGRTYADEQFLRMDSSGVITAVGEFVDTGIADTDGGEFEFGARCHEEWSERHGDGT